MNATLPSGFLISTLCCVAASLFVNSMTNGTPAGASIVDLSNAMFWAARSTSAAAAGLPGAPLGGGAPLAGGRSYAIRSSDLAQLGVSQETPSGKECQDRDPLCVGRADSRWTARLIDVTNPLKPTTVAGNLALQVAVTDKRDGSGDSIAITLWDGNALLFSSSWTGSRTVEQLLAAGTITVD